MWRLVSIAVRNLARNKRRTAINSLAVLFGVAAVILLQGMINGFVAQAVGDTVFAKSGPLQVHKKGFFGADDPLALNMPQDAALEQKILGVPGVTAVTPRLGFEGMISNGADSTMFLATAIDPVREYVVCPKRAQRVAPGSQPLGPGRPSDVLVGKTIADGLGAKMGSSLTLQSAGPKTGANALDVNVSGFLPARYVIESKRMVTVPLALAQDLLRMPGRITEYGIATRTLEEADAVAERLRASIGPDYEVTTWKDMEPAMKDVEGNVRYTMLFVGGVLFLLVASGIVNTMLMSVYERVREIGTMLAVGVRRAQVTVLFLLEAAALGVIGGAAGSALGLGLVRLLGRVGIPVRPPGADMVAMIRPYVAADYALFAFAFAVVGAMAAALWPAWKASRLDPVEALRAN